MLFQNMVMKMLKCKNKILMMSHFGTLWDEKELDVPNSPQMCIFEHPILKSWLKPCQFTFKHIHVYSNTRMFLSSRSSNKLFY